MSVKFVLNMQPNLNYGWKFHAGIFFTLGELMTKGEQNGPLHWFDIHIMFQLQERKFCSPLNLYMYMHVCINFLLDLNVISF